MQKKDKSEKIGNDKKSPTKKVIKKYSRRWMVKAPHCVEEAWKFPFSTCRYRVDTVWDLNRLNSATFVPLAIHTETKVKVKVKL